MSKSVHQFTLKSISGEDLSLSAFSGKKILIVNTASACGYTPQYAQLQELYESHADKLVVLGVPCNDFGAQEPGSETEIQNFCEAKFHVTFPMTGKMKILGSDKHPLYAFLTSRVQNGVTDSEVKWNFQKYLCDEKGELLKVFYSPVDPLSDEILSAIS